MTPKVIQFKQWECRLEFARYTENNRTAIRLIDTTDGSLVAVATINLGDNSLGADEVFIKNYSENEGMLDALVAAGVVRATGEIVYTGFVAVPVAALLIAPEFE